MQIMTSSAIAILGLLLATACGAQPADTGVSPAVEAEDSVPHYSVEIIVFSYAEDIATGTEIFAPEPVAPLIEAPPGGAEPADAAPAAMVPEDEAQAVDTVDEALDDGPRKVYPFSYLLLLPEELTLTDAYSKLELLDAYQPLMHFGWTQPTVAEDQTPALALERFGNVPDGLDGSFKLFLSRYLHLAVDVSLDAAAASAQTEWLADDPYEESVAVFGDDRIQNTDVVGAFPAQYAPLRYQLTERRIMKNGDVRYFDHPRFGVIAKVARIEQDATAESRLP